MKLVYTLTLLAVAYGLGVLEKKSRGTGSWAFDRACLRCQGALICAAVLVWIV